MARTTLDEIRNRRLAAMSKPAVAQVQESYLLDETIAMAETVLATIEFVEIEEPVADDGTPILIETVITFEEDGGAGTFVVHPKLSRIHLLRASEARSVTPKVKNSIFSRSST